VDQALQLSHVLFAEQTLAERFRHQQAQHCGL
jgi:hypothetical protein